MMLFRSVLFLASAVALLAQAPPAKAPASAPQKTAPAFTAAVSPDTVVITVGNTKITAAQFNDLIEMLPEQSRVSARGAGRKQFADQVVRVLAMAEEAKRQKLDQTSAYKVQAEFQTDNLLAGRVFSEMGRVGDAELHQYYDAHKSEFEQIHARHILIRSKGSPIPLEPGKKDLTDEEALAKANELRTKLMGGADFATVASQESDDTGSKGKGGDLGFFHRGQMIPPFEAVAFKLNVGELSQPVKTPFGYHLIKLEAKNAGTFEEAKPEILRKLQPQKAQAAVEELVKKTPVVLDPAFFNTAAK